MRRVLLYLALAAAVVSFLSFLLKMERWIETKRPELPEKTAEKATVKTSNATELNATANETATTPPKMLKSPFPFLITPNRYAYVVLLKEGKVLIFRDGQQVKKGRRVKRSILNRVKRTGLRASVCHRIKGRRFLCIFPDGRYREATLRLLCELLVVAPKLEETAYPENITDFLRKWRLSWMRIKEDFSSYAALYHPSFRNRYGDLRDWLTYRRANLDKIKYIDLVVEDPVYVKMPATEDEYVVFFNQLYRSNIKRVSGLKGLLLKLEEGKLKILTETGL